MEASKEDWVSSRSYNKARIEPYGIIQAPQKVFGVTPLLFEGLIIIQTSVNVALNKKFPRFIKHLCYVMKQHRCNIQVNQYFQYKSNFRIIAFIQA